MLRFFSAIVLSYFLGSIPFAIILTRIVKGVDVRDYGSKNAGATNVFRVAGPGIALLVAVLDLGKGFAATYLIPGWLHHSASPTLLQLQILCACAVILGHMFTIFAGFRGGKGVLTAAGALLALIPVEVGIAFAIFLVIVIISRYVSLGSLGAALTLSIVILVEKVGLKKPIQIELMLISIVITLLVFISHRSNMARLLSGTENRIGKRDHAA